jgi:glucan 1,3-beta-glucosidase
VLKDYYLRAHDAIRATGNDCVLTHAPLLWKQDPFSLEDFTPPPKYSNFWHEWHKYLIWGYEG